MSALSRAISRLPFAPVVALMFGLTALILVLATPQWLFEQAVAASGLASAVPAASPPLGEKARFLSAILAFLAVTGLAWLAARAALPLLERPLPSMPGIAKARPRNGNTSAAETYVTRSRPPIFAGDDLGAPLMSDEAMTIAQDELVLETPLPPASEPAVPDTVGSTTAAAPFPPSAEETAEELAQAPLPDPAEWPVIAPEANRDAWFAEPVAEPPAPRTHIPEREPEPSREAASQPAGGQPTLSQLVDRLEAALAERARRGVPANVPPEGGASTLRRLFAGAGG